LVKYTVRVQLANIDPKVFIGMTANVDIVTSTTQGALAVPLNSIQLDGAHEFVNRVKADGTLERVNVVSGLTQGDLVVVTGELKPGDTVQVLAPKSSATNGGPFGGG
jgi:multidrug efflux pump subunit AcrA (membrane-fusion protein)